MQQTEPFRVLVNPKTKKTNRTKALLALKKILTLTIEEKCDIVMRGNTFYLTLKQAATLQISLEDCGYIVVPQNPNIKEAWDVLYGL